MTKICTKCSLELDLETWFQRHPTCKDGHLGQCKNCRKSYAKTNRVLNAEHYKQYTKQYERKRALLPHRIAAVKLRSKTAKFIQAKKDNERKYRQTAKHKAAKERYVERNPEKHRARRILNEAIQQGKIQRGTCEYPGCASTVEAHHSDYSKPLEVRWLCRKHHAELHRMAKKGLSSL